MDNTTSEFTKEYWDARELKEKIKISSVKKDCTEVFNISFGDGAHGFTTYEPARIAYMYDTILKSEFKDSYKQYLRAKRISKVRTATLYVLLKDWKKCVEDGVKAIQTFAHKNQTVNENQLIQIGMAKGYANMLQIMTYHDKQMRDALDFARYTNGYFNDHFEEGS